MLWGRSVNINGITIALISYKVYIYLEPQDISCIGFFVFVFVFGITCKQLYKLRSFHFVKVCFPWFAVISEQTHTKALNDWGVAEGERGGAATRQRRL